MLATMGAKNSRAPDLMKRWDELSALAPDGWDPDDPPESIVKFIDRNLAGYGHASIAEMAALWIYSDGFGWPAAWLLLDLPLFIGQEASSRVIDQNRVSRQVCRFAPKNLKHLHERWLKVYDGLKGDDGAVYTQDNRRFALPGTMRTGMGYYNNQARAVVRHLEEMSELGGWQGEVAGEYLAAAEIFAEHTVKAARREGRHVPHGRWFNLCLRQMPEGIERPEDGVFVDTSRFHPRGDQDRVTRPGPRRYLDPGWRSDGVIEVRHVLSVGTARDEHRHRACMPWTLEVLVDEYGDPVFCPYTPFDVPRSLWRATCAEFRRIWKTGDKWGALHALPFCAMVSMRASASLDALVYKAELRAGAEGGHWEYKRQNMALIRQLSTLLPQWLVEQESIDGMLKLHVEENLI